MGVAGKGIPSGPDDTCLSRLSVSELDPELAFADVSPLEAARAMAASTDDRLRSVAAGDMGCKSCASLTEVGTRCNLKPPASVFDDAGDKEELGPGPAEAEMLGTVAEPGNEEVDPTEPGEADCGPQGAEGGAEGKALKLVEGLVE